MNSKRSFPVFQIILFSLIVVTHSPAQTYVSGNISVNTNWTRANSPYVLDGDVTVEENVTLILEPGTILKFDAYSRDLKVNGELMAIGTPDDPIIFTSIEDDEYGGDTNGDGDATKPGANDWAAVWLFENSNNLFEHCRFMYGAGSSTSGMIQVFSSDSEFKHCQFLDSYEKGVYATKCSPLFENCRFINNGTLGIYFSGLDQEKALKIKSNIFENNREGAILLSFTNDQVDVWLQDNSSSQSPKNGIIMEGSIAGEVNFTGDPGFPFILDNDLIVQEGALLEIDQGSIIKFASYNDLFSIRGSLHALGLESNPIVFTHITNDAYGGDSNGDEAESIPGTGGNFFSTLSFESSSSNNLLEHCLMEFGGRVGNVNERSASLRIYTSDLRMNNCTVRNAYQNGIYVENASPEFEHNLIANNSLDGIYFTGFDKEIEPVIKENHFLENGDRAMVVQLNDAEVNLRPQNNEALGNAVNGLVVIGKINGDVTFGSQPSFPFVFGTGVGHDVIVNQNASLTIEPGTIVKINQNIYELIVNGSLVAKGTKDQPIVFTSIADDCVGGDTNGDGNASQPTDDRWSRIVFSESAGQCMMDHCIIAFGGYDISSKSMVYIYSDDVQIANCYITQSQNDGLRILGAEPGIFGNLISHNENGVSLYDGANPLMHQNDIVDNWSRGLNNVSGADDFDATDNWWGSITGPYESQSNPEGKGNRVSSNIDFIPWQQDATGNMLADYPDFEFTVENKNVLFEATGNGDLFEWDFGDGSVSQAVNPIHRYETAGEFQVCLSARMCNTRQKTCKSVAIQGVSSFTPDRAANLGDFILSVYGGGFDENTRVRLISVGDRNGDILADSIFFDSSFLASYFKLKNAPVGLYDLEVSFPGDTTYYFKNAITLEEPEWPDPWVEVSGRNKFLKDRPTTYTLQIGNNSNVIAYAVPIWFAVSDVPGLEIEFTGADFGEDPAILLDEDLFGPDHNYFVTDTVLNEYFDARVYPFVVPLIPANSVLEIKMIITSPEDLTMKTWVNDPFFVPEPDQSGFRGLGDFVGEFIGALDKNAFKDNFINCTSALAAREVKKGDKELTENELNCLKENFAKILTAEMKKIPSSLLEAMFNGFHENGTQKLKLPLKEFTIIIALVMDHCLNYSNDARDLLEYDIFWATINIGGTTTQEIKDCLASSCENSRSNFRQQGGCSNCGTYCARNISENKLDAVSSLDPNEKSELSGFGVDNFIPHRETIPYTIYFENKDSATAPAHTVRVIDTLDRTKFDFPTFEFNSVNIADNTIYVEPGQQNILADIHLPDIDVVARITGSFDTLTGEIKWIIQSMDPETLLEIEDPDIGFLPPNVKKPEGEGNVSFYIDLKEGLHNKERVENQALIYFDYNEPIKTNVSGFTLDLGLPESEVEELDAEIPDTLIPVYWTGYDEESGVRLYDVYVSENGEEFERWLARTNKNFAYYSGEIGNNYRFFSVAIDSVGLEESFPNSWDAETNLVVRTEDVGLVNPSVKIYPNPVKSLFSVEFFVHKIPVQLRIYLSSLVGNELANFPVNKVNMGLNSYEFDLSNIPNGIYWLHIEDGIRVTSKKLIIVR
jgi:hypothetical protein